MGTTRDKWGTLDYDKAMKILGKKKERPLCNGNTRLIQTEDGPAVRLWDTNIITYRKDGTIVLRSGGWRTPTTQNRINRYSPYRVYSFKYGGSSGWAVDFNDKNYWFNEGITLSPGGVCDGEMVELDLFERITGIKVGTLAQIRRSLHSLNFKMLARVYRNIFLKLEVIRHAPKEFLPLLIGNVPSDYQEVFEHRLAN